ncbi:MAG: lipocalin-like domain-containing protein [Candidatus Thermoplasmatota archaeon]
MDKSISDDFRLTKKTAFLLFVLAVASSLIIYSVFFTPLFSERSEDEVDEDDWTNYPYVIPGTDMRFPDEEGLYPDGETWISVGTRLDFPDSDLERTYLVTLYHETSKDIYISDPEETHKEHYGGERTLPEGKLDLTFEHTRLEDDRLKTKEGEAFHYEWRSFFEVDGTGYEIDLELESEKPPATVTDYGGEIVLGADYYRIHSLTHCNITGTVSVNGETHEVSGIGWIENQRGSFSGMGWDWFAFWDDRGVEMKIVNVYGAQQNKEYGMYVKIDGETLTIDDLSVEVTSVKRNFGYSWEISSEEHPISLNITCIDERMRYTGFAVGLAKVRGDLMGREVDTLTYVELTKTRSA